MVYFYSHDLYGRFGYLLGGFEENNFYDRGIILK